MQKHQLFIDGKWQVSLSGQFSEVINPATEEVLAQVSKANAVDVDKARVFDSFISQKVLLSLL